MTHPIDQAEDLRARRHRAFNEGCDGRWNQFPRQDNPYDRNKPEEETLSIYWDSGWWDMHNNWGKKVKGKWFYLPLRKVIRDVDLKRMEKETKKGQSK